LRDAVAQGGAEIHDWLAPNRSEGFLLTSVW
jgi:hypothetical protein